MAKKMLIDATHEEETRVAIVENNRLEEYDYESAFRKALKGNIYLAKVTRVEPSLQAAFVNFGGNRHGFLPFSEIHPDYFRIPVSDREALMAAQEEELKEHDAAEAEADADAQAKENEEETDITEEEIIDEIVEDVTTIEPEEKPKRKSRSKKKKDEEEETAETEQPAEAETEEEHDHDEGDVNGNVREPEPDPEEDVDGNTDDAEDNNNKGNRRRGGRGRGRGRGGKGRNAQNRNREPEITDKDDHNSEQSEEQRFRYNLRRKYKIQEVIKRGQIMLVQVSKEERGNKGAAVGSYLSLPGRYCVLMPNSPRSGGVSRKIANYKDRAKMRDMLKEIEVPKGMSVIMRTAGVTRTKTEIKRDLDYLLRLWNKIRELTMESTAPALVYEEADLIKRAVRDLYTRDVEEIIVSGEKGHKNAKEFMKMMIPSHAKRVVEYTDPAPLFARHKVEDQINEMSSPTATMKSGGYLVINPTEALVSIDVNSGKATKERHIEGTALKTNLEAADEVARQLRLRDLGGLVVIDFIDMESRGNNAKVERRLKEALSSDRARIQVGRISSFGLLELSRQRMNPSLTEAQYETCPHCQGTGHIRTPDATSVLVTRAIEEEGIKGRASQLIVHVTTKVALYLLNGKRTHLSELEERYNISIMIRVDDDLAASDFRVEVSKPSEKGAQESDNKGRNNRNDNRNNSRNESKSEDDEDDKPRRRGRRGGRRRNKNRDENQEANQEASSEENAENTNNSAEQETETAEKEPKKRGRRPAAKKEQEAKSESERENTQEASQGEAINEEEKDSKPKKRPSRTKKAKEDSKTDEAPAKEEKAKKAPAKKKTAAKEKEQEAPEASNDKKPEEPSHASNFETVNEAPKKKKKGWWSRG